MKSVEDQKNQDQKEQRRESYRITEVEVMKLESSHVYEKRRAKRSTAKN